MQTSTGIQRHRLRALFDRAEEGNTPEQAGRNRSRIMERISIRSAREGALSLQSGVIMHVHNIQNGWYRGSVNSSQNILYILGFFYYIKERGSESCTET